MPPSTTMEQPQAIAPAAGQTSPMPAAPSAAALDQAFLIRAIELQGKGQDQAAEQMFKLYLEEHPSDPIALYSLAVVHLKRGEPDLAMPLLTWGTTQNPGFAQLWAAMASAQQAKGLRQEALESYDKALEAKPDYIEALINSGALLRESHQHLAALERFNKVLTINPNYESALGNCAILLTEFKRSEQAIAMFQRLLAINPKYDYGQGLLSYERLHACDWTDFDQSSQIIIEGLRKGERTCKSLGLMALSDSAQDHQQSARIFAQHRFPPMKHALWNGERYRHDRIRIAYISPDLREHPVGHLMAGIFEHHDKNRFETIGISLGVDDNSRLRDRMKKAFDHFIDARLMNTQDIARLMRSMEVDVAIDLAGYTSDSRTDVFSHRPAPVQVNYLGYPGTLGLDCMDYIIADRHVIPPEHVGYYDEKVVYLPDSYLPTDGGLQIAERTPTRAECGLPDQGVVFCSFNHDYKISPHVFAVWMRLLKQVPGSVLWLMSRNEVSQRNLRAHAQAQGVEPERLIFAQRVPRVEDHLARYRQADMFLDTHPYNAHTTAADALMAGLPVVTYMGQAFPARVAASLLHTAGLPDMVTYSLDDYEQLALSLATNPTRLADVKARLAQNRATTPLFDTPAFCRNLESIYIAMWRKAQLGQAHDELGA
jgi:protein O-GlcNAc transferase